MENKKRYGFKKIVLTVCWVALGIGTAVLLVAAIRIKDAKLCKGVEIHISGVSNNFFVDKSDILNFIGSLSKGSLVGKATGSFNLIAMEKELRKNIWVKDAELFFDNNEILHVKVNEREPVARVFTTGGGTFYIDADAAVLPLSEKFSAWLPVFTNFPNRGTSFSKADSSLINDIKKISQAIQKDSFRMAMIDQVDITDQRGFEMIPKIGNQVIIFGDASAIEEKFDKLELFYKNVMARSGWNNYSVINLQFNNQVVAKRKGADDVKADSLHTLELMQLIASNAEKLAGDSLTVLKSDNERNGADSIMIQQSIQRDETVNPDTETKPAQTSVNAAPGKKVQSGTVPVKDKRPELQQPGTKQKPGPVLSGNKKEDKKAKPNSTKNDY